jgi:hypothetical protein
MADNKPASSSVREALESSGFSQKGNTSTWTNDAQKREVSVDGRYVKEKGGWINSDNKGKI